MKSFESLHKQKLKELHTLQNKVVFELHFCSGQTSERKHHEYLLSYAAQ